MTDKMHVGMAARAMLSDAARYTRATRAAEPLDQQLAEIRRWNAEVDQRKAEKLERRNMRKWGKA